MKGFCRFWQSFKTSKDAKSIFAALILRQCSNASSKFAILSQCICLAALKMHGCLSGCAGTFKGTDWPSFHPWPCSWSPIIGAYCIKCWAHECSATWTKELCWNFSCPRTGKSLFNNLLYRLSGLYSWSLTMHYDVTIVWHKVQLPEKVKKVLQRMGNHQNKLIEQMIRDGWWPKSESLEIWKQMSEYNSSARWSLPLFLLSQCSKQLWPCFCRQ